MRQNSPLLQQLPSDHPTRCNFWQYDTVLYGSSVFAVVILTNCRSDSGDATNRAESTRTSCRHLLAAPPSVKSSGKAVVFAIHVSTNTHNQVFKQFNKFLSFESPLRVEEVSKFLSF